MSTFLKSRSGYNTCVSICEPTPRKMATSLKRALASSEYAELRLDFLAPADVPPTLELVTPYMHRCVCTLRPKADRGRFAGNEDERLSIIKLVAEYSPMLLDVEIDTIRTSASLRRYLDRAGAHILVSWHDFGRTPPIAFLRRRLATMSRYSNIVKIVTMARNAQDPARVLGLYASAKRTRLVAFCMGDKGRASRVLSLYLGSPFAYVSMGPPAAPGQLGLHEMRRLLPQGNAISFK